MLELAATAVSLGAEFLKERESRAERVGAQEFRDWMENVAFPFLISQADQSLQTLVSMKASNTEQLGRIEAKINELHQLVAGTGGTDPWSELATLDQQILEALYRDAEDGTDEIIDDHELAARLSVATDVLRKSVGYLAEQGYLTQHACLGGTFSVSAEPAGILLAWQAVSPTLLQSTTALVSSMLCEGESHRIGELADEAEVSPLLVSALIGRWVDEGMMAVEEYNAGAEHWLVHSVSQSFIRRMQPRRV